MKSQFSILLLMTLTATSMAAQSGKPATQATTRPYVGVKPMLQAVPENLYPAPKKQWTKMKAELANRALQTVVGKEAVLTFKVREVGHGGMPPEFVEDQGTYWIASEDVSCGTWKIGVVCSFRDDEKGALSAMNVDDMVKVEGQVSRCEFALDAHRGWVLCIDLSYSTLVN